MAMSFSNGIGRDLYGMRRVHAGGGRNNHIFVIEISQHVVKVVAFVLSSAASLIVIVAVLRHIV
jgi:hypothetical protein